MFLSISVPLSRNLTPSLSYHIVRKRIAKVTDFLSFCPFGISIFPFLTIGISMYQKRILPYFIIPSTFSPQASSPLERYGQRNFNTPRYLSFLFFFPLSARGPTRRCNSTGLAELWGGWPIEQERKHMHIHGFSTTKNTFDIVNFLKLSVQCSAWQKKPNFAEQIAEQTASRTK